MLPAGLTRVFYSDNGSTAVEVALKLARAVLEQSRASQRAAPSSRCTTPITATPSARCRRAKTRSSRGRSRRCCFRCIARTRRTAIAARSVSSARPAPIDCLGDLERLLERARRRRRRGARRADAAGRRRHDRLAGGVPRRRPPAVRSLRRADDCRRSADRIRPDRPHVRLRARRRLARHHLPVEGADGAATCRSARPCHRARSTRRFSARIAPGRSSTATRSPPIRWPCAVAIRQPRSVRRDRRAATQYGSSRLGCASGLEPLAALPMRRRRACDRRRRHRRAGVGPCTKTAGGY